MPNTAKIQNFFEEYFSGAGQLGIEQREGAWKHWLVSVEGPRDSTRFQKLLTRFNHERFKRVLTVPGARKAGYGVRKSCESTTVAFFRFMPNAPVELVRKQKDKKSKKSLNQPR